jgi:hypothetical protein
MSKDYTIVTVCTHFPRENYFCLNEYFKSLKEESVLVLDSHYTNYGGLGSKPRSVYKAIKEELINTEYIIFTDCFDFVFSQSPKNLFDTYLAYFPSKPLVISAEKNCFPADLKEEYDKLPYTSSFRYLNSGMVVGKTKDLFKVLESMDATNIPNDYFDTEKNCQINPNDQEYYQKEYLKQPIPMQLDYNQILCNTLHSVQLDDLEFLTMKFIRNKETDTLPCSFHMNGNAKTEGLREPILKHLNLL